MQLMMCYIRHVSICLTLVILPISFESSSVRAQMLKPQDQSAIALNKGPNSDPLINSFELSNTTQPSIAIYLDPVQGLSSSELVQRALLSNGELAAARLEVNRARARLRQAGLRPNPTLDFEQTTGQITGSQGESEISIGIAVPVELGGKRRGRIALAQAELEATETEIADRERRLTGEVLTTYAEVMSAMRLLEITENIKDIDLKTARSVQVRVNEGESAPIELSLIQVEVERLRSQHAATDGRLKAALIRLKSLTGIPVGEQLRLRQTSTRPVLHEPPNTVETAIEIALRTRPDLRLARLTEEVAEAGLQLARAQSAPDITAFTRYSQSRSRFNETPVGTLYDKDRLITFGVAVGIPVFNRNQGLKAESQIAITQAKQRREFLEQMIRAEVSSAYQRLQSAQSSLSIYEQGVINRSNQNVQAIRSAYEIGAFRLTDLLAEQRRLIDSQREYTEALTERYRAIVDLQVAMGVPVINIQGGTK
jgi:outer membrane protein, heavy metal efflux system